MRWTIALAAWLAAIPATAQDVTIDSAVYRERCPRRVAPFWGTAPRKL